MIIGVLVVHQAPGLLIYTRQETLIDFNNITSYVLMSAGLIKVMHVLYVKWNDVSQVRLPEVI